MKFNIAVDGGHQGTADINMDGKGGFTGSVTSDAGQSGVLSGTVDQNGVLTGTAAVEGHTGTFQATINGNAISGTVTARILIFTKTVNFTGTSA